MMATLIDAALRSAVVAAVVALLLWLFRVRSATQRFHVWRLGLIAAALMPFWTVSAPEAARVPVAPVFAAPARMIAAVPEAPAKAVPSTIVAPAVSRPWTHWSIASVLTAVYLAGLFLLTLRLAGGMVMTARLRRGLRAIETNPTGPFDGGTVFESPAVRVPVTIGTFAPLIVLPDGWREWTREKLAAAVAHERAHVIGRDALTLRLAMLYRIVLWFNPLSWWWERHLQALAEQAADESVLQATGVDPHAYARILLDFYDAVSQSGSRAAWHLAMAKGAVHRIRLERILEWDGTRMSARRLAVSVVMVLVVCTAALSASMTQATQLRSAHMTYRFPAVQVPGTGRVVGLPIARPSSPAPPARSQQPAPRDVPEPQAAPAARPNFAGVWVPADARRASALFDVGLSDIPDSGMTITQDDDTLTITRMASSATAAMSVLSPRFGIRSVYKLDGSSAQDPGGTERSSARWDGDALVIDTAGPVGARRITLSMSGTILRMEVAFTTAQGISNTMVSHYVARAAPATFGRPVIVARPGTSAEIICGLTVMKPSPDLDSHILLPPDRSTGAAVRRIEPQVCTAAR